MKRFQNLLNVIHTATALLHDSLLTGSPFFFHADAESHAIHDTAAEQLNGRLLGVDSGHADLCHEFFERSRRKAE